MFTEIFGDSPRVKLLDFLADHPDFDYTISQLEEFAEVSRPTISKLIEELKHDDFVVPTREIGSSQFFRLNTDNPKMIAMLQADFEHTNEELAATNFGESRAEARRTARKIRPKKSSVRAVRRPSLAYLATGSANERTRL